jgi:hypothetical protein
VLHGRRFLMLLRSGLFEPAPSRCSCVVKVCRIPSTQQSQISLINTRRADFELHAVSSLSLHCRMCQQASSARIRYGFLVRPCQAPLFLLAFQAVPLL